MSDFERVEIGPHVLYHGDCLEILPTLEAGSIDAVVTDPPYGMAFQSNHRRDRHGRIPGDNSTELLAAACRIPACHSRYVFCRWENLGDVPKPRSVVTWIKNNWSMGDLDHEHARQTESILFWPGKRHSWPDKRPADVVFAPRSGNDNHPLEKSVGLMTQVVGWTCGTVFDPFMGNGTTGVACAKLGRRFIGIEIERKYFDIACRRIDAEVRQGKFAFTDAGGCR